MLETKDLGKKHVGELIGIGVKWKEFCISQYVIAHLRATTTEQIPNNQVGRLWLSQLLSAKVCLSPAYWARGRVVKVTEMEECRDSLSSRLIQLLRLLTV